MVKKLSKIKREGNVYWIDLAKNKFNTSGNGGIETGIINLSIYYHGKPREA